MYNFFKFEDERNDKLKEMRVQKKLKKVHSQQRLKRDELVTHYNHRIQRFIVEVIICEFTVILILQMLDKPIVVKDFSPAAKDFSHREQGSDQKMLGPQRENVKENQQLYGDKLAEKYVDRCKLLNLRERQKDKEIVKEFKFQPKTSLDRVKETLLKNQFYLQLDNNQPIIRRDTANERGIGSGGASARLMSQAQKSNLLLKMETLSSDGGKSSTPTSSKGRSQHESVAYYGSSKTSRNYLFRQKIKQIDNNKLKDLGNDHSIDQVNTSKQKDKKKGDHISSFIFDNEISPKDLRPDLHVKSHFKGTQMLTIKPQVSKEYLSSQYGHFSRETNGHSSMSQFLIPAFTKGCKTTRENTQSDFYNQSLKTTQKEKEKLNSLQVLSSKAMNPLRLDNKSTHVQSTNFIQQEVIKSSSNKPLENIQLSLIRPNLQMMNKGSLPSSLSVQFADIITKNDKKITFQASSQGDKSMKIPLSIGGTPGIHGVTTREEKEFAVKSNGQGKYAHEVLLMCNMAKERDPRSIKSMGSMTMTLKQTPEYLKKGDGKMSSNIDQNNLEIYERIKRDFFTQRNKH
ncbi:UNKNOWN [Stylonychia lemnae]|uniref:Uncharacterized protein n=1 Tax=Stylonychia lemnae TaxID=5949 RepID=A0A078B2J7_STYLE|nr:UNKNOWN [Stylonychia lemnae]|eukprot:CDW88461.1 UNKNOWN [Stylonychia lemnae]